MQSAEVARKSAELLLAAVLGKKQLKSATSLTKVIERPATLKKPTPPIKHSKSNITVEKSTYKYRQPSKNNLSNEVRSTSRPTIEVFKPVIVLPKNRVEHKPAIAPSRIKIPAILPTHNKTDMPLKIYKQTEFPRVVKKTIERQIVATNPGKIPAPRSYINNQKETIKKVTPLIHETVQDYDTKVFDEPYQTAEWQEIIPAQDFPTIEDLNTLYQPFTYNPGEMVITEEGRVPQFVTTHLNFIELLQPTAVTEAPFTPNQTQIETLAAEEPLPQVCVEVINKFATLELEQAEKASSLLQKISNLNIKDTSLIQLNSHELAPLEEQELEQLCRELFKSLDIPYTPEAAVEFSKAVFRIQELKNILTIQPDMWLDTSMHEVLAGDVNPSFMQVLEQSTRKLGSLILQLTGATT